MIVLVAVLVLLVVVVLVLWRRAAERIVQAEAAKLAQSFKREAEAEAEKKKELITEKLGEQKAEIDAMAPEQLEKEINK
jgi:flagellar biosynthesis/type III secretory pathway M-ring protein FliF/YscJ